MPRAEFTESFEGTSGTLIFPQDMEKEFYPEAIKFSVYERSGIEYKVIKELLKDGAATSAGFISAHNDLVITKDAIKRLYEENKELSVKERRERIKANKEAGKPTLSGTVIELETKRAGIESDIDSAELAFKLTGGAIKGQLDKVREDNTLENTKTRHLKSIYLAMPESLNFAEGVDWQGTDLGVIGGLKSGALGLDNGLDYGILTGAGAALGGAGGLAASLIPGISGIAGTIVGAVLGGSGLQSGIESTFGVKTNPFKEQTFQGVGFRPFDFSFTFRPRSESDVNVVQNIIQTFRAYSKPTFKDAAGTIFKYPKEFLIEFLTIEDGAYETNEYIPQIKFCVCTVVNTNFTGTGWRSFKGGAPTEITLQLTFQETEIITGEDVLGNTEVGRFAGEGRRF